MKRVVCLLMSFFLLLTGTFLSVQASVLRGDINGDGKVNAKDYLILKRYVLGTYSLQMDNFTYRADLNQDGNKNAKDYLVLKRYVLGTYSVKQDVVLSGDEFTLPKLNEKFATLSIAGTTLQDIDVYYGDNTKVLKLGAGMYSGSSFPGCGSTCLISAHNDTFFHYLGTAKKNAMITLTTSYGTYQYRIIRTAKLDESDTSAYDLSGNEELLVLYTCYPFSTIRPTTTRYFVYAEYVSGPQLV